MRPERLSSKAWVVITLSGLYSAAAALSSVFVAVYLWVNSLDLAPVMRHHVALFAVTPLSFVAAGWYAKARDRLHMFRAGLACHAVFYGVLLGLQERSPQYAGWLGALLGVTWGIYYAGANTLNFDVTRLGRREYYFGLLQAVTGAVSLAAPLVSGLVIRYADSPRAGYNRVFGLVVLLYVASFGLSYLLPADKQRKPYRIWRALFPGKEQRDWRIMLGVSASLAGSFNIFPFLLGLLMYMETESELTVGGYASFQALAAVIVAYLTGRVVSARNRRVFMQWGVGTLVAAGIIMLVFPLGVVTLMLFGLLRSISGPLFGVPHQSLNLDIIAHSCEEPSQRIEYLAAWEVPLALGRVAMMLLIWGLYTAMGGNEFALRLMLFVLCAIRLVSYQLVTRTSPMQAGR